MRNLGCLLAAALLVACGPTETIDADPDAGEEVDASLDNALVEGEWAVSMDISSPDCQATSFDVPMFDIEVESDGDVVAACLECAEISAQVYSSETMHVQLTKQIGGSSNPGWKAIVTLDCSDDGVSASCAVDVVIATTTCAASDPDAAVTRVRE